MYIFVKFLNVWPGPQVTNFLQVITQLQFELWSQRYAFFFINLGRGLLYKILVTVRPFLQFLSYKTLNHAYYPSLLTYFSKNGSTHCLFLNNYLKYWNTNTDLLQFRLVLKEVGLNFKINFIYFLSLIHEMINLGFWMID